MSCYYKNSSNSDSIHKALYLLDSATALHPLWTFYLFKYEIFRGTNRPKAALLVCDSALILDKHNYAATLSKGYTFEAMGKPDSALYYYTAALRIIESPMYSNSKSSAMAIDDQRIILKGLLNDTIAFKQLVVAFKRKYQDTSDIYKAEMDAFTHFRRNDYVQTGGYVARDSAEAIQDTTQ